MKGENCRLVEQGFEQGSCLTSSIGTRDAACRVALKWKHEVPYRLIYSHSHKAPEHYLSIYQSGCNLSCRKCHSWSFSKYAAGEWMSPADIADLAYIYAELNKDVMYMEPRSRATSWHARKLCHGCGSCVVTKKRSEYCPGKLDTDRITLLNDMTWGPARNIISFTGGDLSCQPEFYVKSAEEIKNLKKNLWVMLETNGYGLTPKNLDAFKEAGIDSFWLDIKAYDDEVHRRLTGVSNRLILKLPALIKEKGFVLEVLSLYIPGLVETDQLGKIADLLAQVDPGIPFTILAFFPAYKLIHVPSPDLHQMIEAYHAANDAGLKNVRLGNVGRFVRTRAEFESLVEEIGIAF